MIVNVAPDVDTHLNIKIYSHCMRKIKINLRLSLFLAMIMVLKNQVPIQKLKTFVRRIMVFHLPWVLSKR